MKTYTREDIGPNDTCRWVRLVDVEAETNRLLAEVNELTASLKTANENLRACRNRAEAYQADIQFLRECRQNQAETIKKLRLELDGGLPR